MREDPIETRGSRRPGWHPQRQLIHLRLVSWHEVALLAAIAAVAAYLLAERDQSDKNQARQTLVGHAGTVESIAFRPDGMMLCSVGVDSSIMLWDLATNQEYSFRHGEIGRVRCAAFSPDSKILAIANLTGAVALYDLVSNELCTLYDPHNTTAGARCLAFAPDGTTLAVGQKDGQITLWDVVTGQGQQALSGHTGFIAALTFSTDGRTLASSSGDRSVRLWDQPTGRGRFVFSGQTNTVTALVFSPNGQYLVMGDKVSPVIQLSEITTGCEHMVRHVVTGNLVAVAISPDSATLAAANFHGLVTSWNLPSLKINPVRLRHAGVHSLAFAPDGRTLATGGFDGTIHLWDWPRSAMVNALRPTATSTALVNFSSRVPSTATQAGTSGANRPAASVQAAVARGS
jgi:WD40 repeat protein